MDASDLRRFADRARAELPELRFAKVQELPRRTLEALADGRVPRDGLTRATDDGEVKGADDGRTIEGYGGVTNQRTTIDSWEGLFDEEFLTGSFKRTARNQIPKMQFDHGKSMLLGSVPMGAWERAEEDDHGLHLGPGRVFDNPWTMPIRDAIAAGEIPGMSIRFSVVREVWIDRNGKEIKDEGELFDLIFWGNGLDERGPIVRQIKEAKVTEAGPVVWPAYEGTSVGLRSGTVTIDLGRLDDPAQQRLLARAVYLADAGQVRSTTSDSQLTERSSDDTEHATRQTATAPISVQLQPDAAPLEVTDASPEEHSRPPAMPANPVERAQQIRRELREVNHRLWAIPKKPNTEGSP